MNRKKSLHDTLQQRVYGHLSVGSVVKTARGSRSFVQRLQRDHVLSGHSGCVNTISWSNCGELLLSGSDDCKLNIYKPVAKKLVQSIRSGHRANVFSAKFLPCTGNRGIVSCAGDGMIQYTDVERESTYGQYQFNCHSGTTYDVVTTPGDPNTFLTCGEDGTVRLFDLRTKTSCSCRECKDDVLLDCGKAVTSISVNPTTPYHLAVGCEDSIVRVFDRRTITTNLHSSNANKLQGLFSQFKPETLKDRMCRVTSLQYSEDGSELLVSYCADYVYLFSLLGRQMLCSKNDETDRPSNGFHSAENGGQRNVPPLKRLRLRGDWSDTGPNARPESEHPSEESSLMQRMSDMFARWLDESFRAGQRRRAQSSRQRSGSSQDSTSSGDSSVSLFDSGSTSPSAGEEIPSPEQLHEIQSDLSGDESTAAVQGDVDVSQTGSDRETFNSPALTNSQDPGCHSNSTVSCPDVQQQKTEKSSFFDKEDLDENNTNHNNVLSQANENFSNINPVCETEAKSCTSNNSDCRYSTSSLRNRNCSDQATTSTKDVELVSGDLSQPGGSQDYSNKTKTDDIYLNSMCSNPRKHIDTRTEPGFVSQKQVFFESMEKKDTRDSRLSTVQTPGSISDKSSRKECKITDSSRSTLKDYQMNEYRENSSSASSLPSVHVEQVDCGTGDVHDKMDANNIQNEGTDTGLQNQSTVRTRGETSAGSQVDTRGDDEGSLDADSRNHAATRIQRMFRQRKMFKAFSDGSEDAQEYWVPEMNRMYKGHRNARTMIKEANFWGDHHILSGSDCGRIFIWDKHTAEIVAILQGDHHVVNCVQPHPHDPVLASSGIDYDIKIWAPIAEEPIELTDADEIVRRNEKMLEESRDTITVPASFMLRMLASLNHSRFTRRNQDNDSDSGSSDDD